MGSKRRLGSTQLAMEVADTLDEAANMQLGTAAQQAALLGAQVGAQLALVAAVQELSATVSAAAERVAIATHRSRA